jgi:UDP-2,3-diacylglucosamine pyrophosphatase LpxH
LENECRHYRAIFISDVHLGTKGCQSRSLLDFLRDCEAETIYLVGDIVDAWRLRQGWYWPQDHNDVVQKLLRKVRKGVRLIYIPGNHDEFLKSYLGVHFGGVEVVESAIHLGADGRRYLVVHGDAFDAVVRHARWLALLGDWAYDMALVINVGVNAVRRRLGLTYWSLSQWAKLKVKSAVNFIGDYEQALVTEARRHRVDGIICGHIHHAIIHDRLGVRYMNCGDWVESCTALVETYDGAFELIHWSEAAPLQARQPIAPAKPESDPVGVLVGGRGIEGREARHRVEAPGHASFAETETTGLDVDGRPSNNRRDALNPV